MMHHRYRNLMEDERGAALVIGAVGILIMAVMVMASVSIGNGVYAKIKLQDAADAQAYTTAVKMARAYNFFAYTNRAMVVHHNAILTFMSFVSHAYYLKETLGRIAGYLRYLPYVGPIFNAIQQIINAWMQIVDTLARVVVPVLTALNVGLWLAQEALTVSTVADLSVSDGRANAANLTDPKASVNVLAGVFFPAAGAVLNVMNAGDFLHPIHDATTGYNIFNTGVSKRIELIKNNLQLSNVDMAKYRLLMNSIVNSARGEWTAVGKGPVLLGRRWRITAGLGVCISFVKSAFSEMRSFENKDLKDQYLANEELRFRIGFGIGPLCVLRDVFKLRMVAAADKYQGGGFHALNLSGTSVGTKRDRHHPAYGVTPYMLGRVSFWNPRKNHFNQPCNVAVATKDMMGGQRKAFEMKFDYMKNQGTTSRGGMGAAAPSISALPGAGSLDMTWAGKAARDTTALNFNNRSGGMMAIAVGRAIYHRPGAWKEEPNFFNPLWTARLAPVLTHWNMFEVSVLVPEIALFQRGIFH